jgi:predicted naringenin-chalcone synthase
MTFTYITELTPLLPPFIQPQGATLDWIARMHTEAETLSKGLDSITKEAFFVKLSRLINKIGLGDEKIKNRRLFFEDFFKENLEPKKIYDLSHGAQGANLSLRTQLYAEVSHNCLEEIYKDNQVEAPDHLIHTTCTGYASPSPAQKLISSKNWGDQTTITHAYHMGCYASIPSIRMGSAFLKNGAKSCDVIHTEFCSLHMDLLNHSMGQLVIESLFADGAISYKLKTHLNRGQKGFKLIKTHEKLIPNSLHGMSWETAPFGFAMTLSKDVPSLISGSIEDFIKTLLKDTARSPEIPIIYAIHPGGPKIIDQVATLLELEYSQYCYSSMVLKEHGNMSSATLPHVWEKILNDDAVPNGSIIVSLAFGPGLTIAGAVFEKSEGH